jgi:acetyl-CoA decarbonylase/synthase complex subunit gamma
MRGLLALGAVGILAAAAALLAAVLAGAVLTPVLLPWLPGRAFSCKGLVTGLLAAAAVVLAGGPDTASGYQTIAWLLLIPALSSFTGMSFTGASTYTSLSGVRREMRLAVPLQMTAGVIGLGFWFASLWPG